MSNKIQLGLIVVITILVITNIYTLVIVNSTIKVGDEMESHLQTYKNYNRSVIDQHELEKH